jgi:signal transduction histidine kinase
MSNINERILIFAASQKDAESTCRILSRSKIECEKCSSLEVLLNELRKGAGAVILAKEVLTLNSISILSRFLDQQPTWSFLPLIILIGAGDLAQGNSEALKLLKPLRNTTLLERPVRIETLTSVAQSAIADRRRQYEVRDLVAALEASKKEAIEANQAKSVFLANMSHEIRTPLGAILGFSEILMEPGLTEQERETYINTIKRNGSLLTALIDDILDLAKVESGKIAVETISVSVSDLLREVMLALEPRALAKNVPLSVTLSSDVPKTIQTDPIRLKQVLINIIGNAIKFTTAGHVSIRAFASQSEQAQNRHMLHFEVTDTGLGISPDQVTHLFQPFTQADSSITRKFGGTGLGLVLSKKLAQALGGDLILVKSEIGVGSQFQITIDTNHGLATEIKPTIQQPAPSKSSNQTLPLKDCRILLVDDSVDNVMLITRLLNHSGAHVTSAHDGIEGVQAALAEEFDVVLMDVQMPHMDGREATQTLRQKGFAKPIIALTGHSDDEDRRKCLAVGYNHFVTKPIQRAELIQLISGCIGH